MKNFSSKTKESFHPSSRKRWLLRLILLLVVLILALYFFRGFFGDAASFFSSPIYNTRTWFSESSAMIPSYMRDRNELTREIESLKEELLYADRKNVTIGKLSRENEELRLLLAIEDEQLVVAAVSARPPFLPYDSILIDRGADDEIEEESIVYLGSGEVLGFVSKVFKQSALVTMFSTPGITATAYIIGPDIYTTLTGEGGGVMRVTIPQGIVLKAGDTAIVPSVGAGVIGTVVEVESQSTQPTQTGYVLSDIPIQSINLVGVSTRKVEQVSYEEAESIIQREREKDLRIDVPNLSESDSATTSDTDLTVPDQSEEGTEEVIEE